MLAHRDTVVNKQSPYLHETSISIRCDKIPAQYSQSYLTDPIAQRSHHLGGEIQIQRGERNSLKVTQQVSSKAGIQTRFPDQKSQC